jgi:hypothetical protein
MLFGHPLAARAQVYGLIDFTVEIEGVSSGDVEDVQEGEITRAAAAERYDDDK